jgi:hypothetical protein
VKALLVILALSVPCVLVPAAAARQVVTLNAGDSVLIRGTDIACTVGKSGSKLHVSCLRANAKGAIPGSYVADLRSDGASSIERVVTPRKFQTVVRFPAGVGTSAGGRIYKLRSGDGFKIAGTMIGCNIAPGGSPGCFHYNDAGIVPSSYGTVLTEKYAGILKYDAGGANGKLVRFKLHGR